MLSPFDYLIWCVGFLAGIYVVVCSLARKQFMRYLYLHIYILATAVASMAQFVILRDYGFTSHQYKYAYYYGDCLLTVLLYLVVIGLYSHVFEELKASRYLRVATVLLLLGVTGFSYIVVHHNEQNLNGKLALEISQNLYFVGAVLTYGLWVAVLKLRETRARLIQLVLAMGVYFSASAGLYALRNMFPDFEFLHGIPPLLGVWLPMAWAYTLTRIPEEAQLAPSALAAEAR